MDLTNNDIANDDNDKYRNHTNLKSDSSNSKEDTHTIQSEIINFKKYKFIKYELL